jgi:hypothetical protein
LVSIPIHHDVPETVWEGREGKGQVGREGEGRGREDVRPLEAFSFIKLLQIWEICDNVMTIGIAEKRSERNEQREGREGVGI